MCSSRSLLLSLILSSLMHEKQKARKRESGKRSEYDGEVAERSRHFVFSLQRTTGAAEVSSSPVIVLFRIKREKRSDKNIRE